MSSHRSSRIIGPLLRWLKPDVSDETVYGIQYVVRKMAHLTEYGVLAVLFWRARRKPVKNDIRPWRWSEAAVAVGFVAVYALSDEWHQSWVPSRDGRWSDVFLDVVGAVGGLLLLWRWGRWRRRW